MKLTIEHLKAGYESVVIIDDLSLAIPEGKITALIGANGCGKSTLLKTICRIQPRLGGRVLLDGADVHEADPRALAKSIAILPQNPTAPEGLTVRELVFLAHDSEGSRDDRLGAHGDEHDGVPAPSDRCDVGRTAPARMDCDGGCAGYRNPLSR